MSLEISSFGLLSLMFQNLKNCPEKTKADFIQNKHVYPYKLYSSLVAMVYVLDRIASESVFKQNLLKLLNECKPTQMKKMGFPTDWQQEKFWQI